MKYLYGISLLFGIAFGSSEMKVTVSNCTKSTDEARLTSLTLSPPSPEKVNTNWTVTGTANILDDITEGTFTAVLLLFLMRIFALRFIHILHVYCQQTNKQEAKFLGVPIFSQTGNICKEDKIVLPLGYGIIYFGGITCPAEKGENIAVPVTSYVSSSAPDDTIKVSVTAEDTKTKHQIFCVNVEVEIEKESE